MRLVCAWDGNRPVLHTALDDLESFLWVLVCSLVYIFKDTATITKEPVTINHLAQMFSSHHYGDVISKGLAVETWPDKVFRGLIREWLMTSVDSRRFLLQLEDTLSNAESRNDIESLKRECDRLEKCCGEVYIKYIQAGYSHLKYIRGYEDWKAVVDADGEKLYR